MLSPSLARPFPVRFSASCVCLSQDSGMDRTAMGGDHNRSGETTTGRVRSQQSKAPGTVRSQPTRKRIKKTH
eukprot:8335081-Pyramimonas_sp.AAC.1